MLRVTNNLRNTHYNHNIPIPLRTATRNKREIIMSDKNGNKMELLRLFSTACIFLSNVRNTTPYDLLPPLCMSAQRN